MSLIESTVAVAIAGTAIAAVTPSILRSREAYTLRSAAQDVVATLYSARIHAISDGRDCRFHVLTPTSYAVECQTAASAWTEVDRRSTPQGLTVTANNRPEFHPRGNVSPAATITVWNASGRSMRVVVNTNGRVREQ
jgi:type II secretory pathway pseudopilin PulG